MFFIGKSKKANENRKILPSKWDFSTVKWLKKTTSITSHIYIHEIRVTVKNQTLDFQNATLPFSLCWGFYRQLSRKQTCSTFYTVPPLIISQGADPVHSIPGINSGD